MPPHRVILCVNQVTNAIDRLVPSWNALSKAKRAVKTLEPVLVLGSAEPRKGRCFKECRGKIEFRNVSFSYPSRPEHGVFRGLNLLLEPGTTTAIVGPSGSGKSSLVTLIERWFEPSDGEILLDDQTLASLDATCLRRQIGLVQQVNDDTVLLAADR